MKVAMLQVSDLEVVVTREGNEEVKKKTFAVFIDLCSIMVHTWKKGQHFEKSGQ